MKTTINKILETTHNSRKKEIASVVDMTGKIKDYHRKMNEEDEQYHTTTKTIGEYYKAHKPPKSLCWMRTCKNGKIVYSNKTFLNKKDAITAISISEKPEEGDEIALIKIMNHYIFKNGKLVESR